MKTIQNSTAEFVRAESSKKFSRFDFDSDFNGFFALFTIWQQQQKVSMHEVCVIFFPVQDKKLMSACRSR